jgi:pimeloyl-ACP methyl ester carboxylesterase
MMKVTEVILGTLCLATVLGAQTEIGAPPGQMVDIGGRKLHLVCSGTGSPTVILEAGASSFAIDWTLVQRDITRTNRVCSYDRAGDGWSELGPHPRTLRQIVYELHTLLERAGEDHPFVLVGHSFGGWPVRAYAATYPSEVAGIVLVEGGHDNPWRKLPERGLVRSSELATGAPFPAVQTSNPLRLSDLQGRIRDQIQAGVAQLRRNPNEPPRHKLPADAQRMRAWALGRMGHILAGVNPFLEEELALLRAAREQNGKLYGDMPLVVITRGLSHESGPDSKTFHEERKQEHAVLASLSRRGKHIIAQRSGHHVQIDQPELVVEAIREVVRAAQRDGP